MLADTSPVPSFLSGFYVHVGAASILPDTSAKVKTAGRVVPNAGIAINSTATAEVEAGYRITPAWAVSVTGGIPRSSNLYGAGSLAGYGKLGSTNAGAVTATAHYHFTGLGRLQPYVGGGLAYLVVLDSQDGTLSRLKVEPAFGGVVQGGFDYMLTEHAGVFVDVKKAFLQTDTRAYAGYVPVRGTVRLDPLAISSGLTYRF